MDLRARVMTCASIGLRGEFRRAGQAGLPAHAPIPFVVDAY